MMSDFTSNFWNYYIIIFTVLGLLFCFYLTLVLSGKIEKDAKNDPSHVWDGNLSEYNNPLPSWWRNMFLLLLVFSVGYLVYYPGLGAFEGLGKWTQLKQYEKEMADLNAKTKPMYDRFAMIVKEKGYDALGKDDQAMAVGHRLYLNNCAQCHAKEAKGQIGYPDLTKASGWRWGLTPEKVTEIIKDGIGVAPDSSDSMDAVSLDGADPAPLVAYVRSLSGIEKVTPDVMQKGKALYDDKCAVCHGDKGEGNPDGGFPNLADGYWIYSSSDKSIRNVIANGTTAAMPKADPGILNDAQIQVLTAYVLHLKDKKENAK